MGTTNRKLLQMISLQAAEVGAIGYGLGIGAASAWGGFVGPDPDSVPISVAVATRERRCGDAHLRGCAAISIRKVIKLEPAIVFRS